MALAGPTLLKAEGNETDGLTGTTGTFTPTAGAIIIATVAHGDAGGAGSNGGIADTFLGGIGAWTLLFDLLDGPNNSVRLTSWWALVGAGGTGTIVFTSGGSDNRWVWNVVEFTGANTSAPISEDDSVTSLGSTTESIALADIAAGNIAYGCVVGYGALGIDPGTNETELASSEVVSGANSPVLTMQSESGTDNTVDWSSLSSSGNHHAIAMEIAAAAAAVSRVPIRERQYPRGVMRGVLRGAIR